MIRIKSIIAQMSILIVWILVLSSCSSTSKIVYLQDLHSDYSIAVQETKDLTLKTGDKLSIVVYSRDSELAQMFNLDSNRSGSGGSNNHENTYYTVDDAGKIDMPVLGPISVKGMTRMELAELIKQKLLTEKLISDPTVTVEYANMGYYVLGEVGNPGRIEIERDNITLLEALATAGDLTIQGRRDNILVLRTENGSQTPYRVDITQAQSLYSSPVYYLQQNDMIYVEPNKMRANQSKLNANTLRTPGFWFSTTSFILSLVLLFTK
ncbi:MAG: polysaccharide export protein [Prevotella sp.]|nr:polysaccharide export protein [Prevotella sp.]